MYDPLCYQYTRFVVGDTARTCSLANCWVCLSVAEVNQIRCLVALQYVLGVPNIEYSRSDSAAVGCMNLPSALPRRGQPQQRKRWHRSSSEDAGCTIQGHPPRPSAGGISGDRREATLSTRVISMCAVSAICTCAGSGGRRLIRLLLLDRLVLQLDLRGGLCFIYLSLSIYIYIYTYIHLSLSLYIYIYIAGPERQVCKPTLSAEKAASADLCVLCIYIYIYIERERDVYMYVLCICLFSYLFTCCLFKAASADLPEAEFPLPE